MSSLRNAGKAAEAADEAARARKLAKARDDVRLDVAQFLLDLIGIFEPTPFADTTSALISIWRGDALGAVTSAASLLPYIGDTAKVLKLPERLAAVRRAIKLASTDAKFAEQLEKALARIKAVIDNTKMEVIPSGIRPSIQALKAEIDEFLTARLFQRLRKRKLPLKQLLHEARANGSVGKQQFYMTRGGKSFKVNVDDVVELLENGAQAGRHPAIKKDSKMLLEVMADNKWTITSSPHPVHGAKPGPGLGELKTEDLTEHITVKILGDKSRPSFHLRMNKEGHLFEVTDASGNNLSRIPAYASPGTPLD